MHISCYVCSVMKTFLCSIHLLFVLNTSRPSRLGIYYYCLNYKKHIAWLIIISGIYLFADVADARAIITACRKYFNAFHITWFNVADLFMDLNSMVSELFSNDRSQVLFCYVEPLSNQIAAHLKTQNNILLPEVRQASLMFKYHDGKLWHWSIIITCPPIK